MLTILIMKLSQNFPKVKKLEISENSENSKLYEARGYSRSLRKKSRKILESRTAPYQGPNFSLLKTRAVRGFLVVFVSADDCSTFTGSV